MISSLVLHFPHASTEIPPDLRDTFLLSEQELQVEINRITDHATDLIFQQAFPAAPAAVFPISRLVVDPERFCDDLKEPMSLVGMGVICIYHGNTSAEASRGPNPLSSSTVVGSVLSPASP